MSSQTPNSIIGKFVTFRQCPQVPQSHDSGAVPSSLGGLSNSTSGMKTTLVKSQQQKDGIVVLSIANDWVRVMHCI
jgi:hypothetical protein